MMQVDVLKETLEKGGLWTDKQEAAWDRFMDLRRGRTKLPAPVAYEEIEKVRVKMDQALAAGNQVKAGELARQVREMSGQREEQIRRKKALNEAIDEARVDAARVTREVLRRVIEECGREIAHIAATAPHYGFPQLLPERVPQLFQRAAWAQQVCLQNGLLSFGQELKEPRLPHPLAWIVDKIQAVVVARRCGAESRPGVANL